MSQTLSALNHLSTLVVENIDLGMIDLPEIQRTSRNMPSASNCTLPRCATGMPCPAPARTWTIGLS